jgi:hypothetical protein
MEEILKKVLEKLPVQLLLMMAVLVITGLLLLKAEGQPPSIPRQNLLGFILMAVLIVLVAAGLFLIDKKSTKEAAKARIAEETANAKVAEETAKTQLAKAKVEHLENQAENFKQFIDKIKAQPGSERDIWTRVVPRLPLEKRVALAIISMLSQARDAAAKALVKTAPEADPNSVRANVFLPTSSAAVRGDVCTLIIPETEGLRLQVNMKKPDELDVRFRPGEGATGRVFVESEPLWVFTNPKWLDADEEGRKEIIRWVDVPVLDKIGRESVIAQQLRSGAEERFDMSTFSQRRVAKRLSWIISLPLMLHTRAGSETAGVMNVDCVGFSIRPQDFQPIYDAVTGFSERVAAILAEVPLDRLAIIRFNE